MKYKNPFRGLGVAVVTPFDENGCVDYTALRQLVNDIVENGADFLCALGTSAETPTLTDDEKSLILKTVIEENNGRLPLMLGCGTNNTRQVCDYLQTADLTGVDGVLLVVPYYNKPRQEGIYQHYRAIAENSPLPIILYNVPGRTGVNMQPDTVIRLAQDCDAIVGIKEASGNLEQAQVIIDNAPEGFDVLSGDDCIACDMIELGAKGVVSVIGNAFTGDFATAIHHAVKGEHELAKAENLRLAELIRLTMVDGNPAGIKAMLKTQGRINGKMRLPLVEVTSSTFEQIRTEIENL